VIAFGRVTHLCFDLDGTLTDSREGIARSLQHAVVSLGRPEPPEASLRRFIGPPLHDSLATLLGSDDEALVLRAVAAYRERFEAVGLFENRVYPGIEPLLASLGARGHRLSVVTAKPLVYARRVLDHFGLTGAFHSVHGPAFGDRRPDKAALLDEALRAGATPAASAAMVGDRADDVAAARRVGTLAVAVGWGYGERAELEAAAPDALVDSTADLMTVIETAA
jgi:phosphoglycolate phosphatase